MQHAHQAWLACILRSESSRLGISLERHYVMLSGHVAAHLCTEQTDEALKGLSLLDRYLAKLQVWLTCDHNDHQCSWLALNQLFGMEIGPATKV